ncbi:unnamed protein product [Scytosiphon promiscuus]
MQYPYGRYIGQATPDARLMCDIPHGRGSFFYNDGSVYEGSWNRGNWEGQAVRTWPLGARYVGAFRDNLQHGKGSLVLPNGGGGYSGDWAFGFQHGKGMLTTPDGQTCEGDFVEGNPHGKGIMKTPDGTVYEGDFENGLPHGKGVTTYLDGSRYVGDFQDGEMHGEGATFDAEGNELRKGMWLHDEEATS